MSKIYHACAECGIDCLCNRCRNDTDDRVCCMAHSYDGSCPVPEGGCMDFVPEETHHEDGKA